MKNAFELLFQMSNPRKPDKLQTDAGKEFLNKDVQKILKSHGVHHFVSHSDKIAAVVERFNRTLKIKIWTYSIFHKFEPPYSTVLSTIDRRVQKKQI